MSVSMAVTIASLRYCDSVSGTCGDRRCRSLGARYIVGPVVCRRVGGWVWRLVLSSTSRGFGGAKGWVMWAEWRVDCVLWCIWRGVVVVALWVARQRAIEGW